MLLNSKSSVDFWGKVAAVKIFSSYLFREFYKHGDQWSIFQGWTVCASQIAAFAEAGAFNHATWQPGFDLGKQAAFDALALLANEFVGTDSLRVAERELDDFTRVRNTFTAAA